MTKYDITIYAKHKKPINNFLKLFNNPCIKTKSFQLLLNSIKKKQIKKNIITVLKSPHVNKKAQEHFQSITYIIKLECFFLYPKKNIILLKKIKNQLFPDLNIKIKKKLSKKENQIQNTLLNPNKIIYTNTNFSFKQQQNLITLSKNIKTQNILQNTLTYLKSLDNNTII